MGASFVLAERQLEVTYPEIGGITPTTTTISLPQYVKYIFNFSIGISILITIAVLIYAGFRYLTSAGSATAMADAKERIGAAILGLLVILGSYLILTTINPQLVFLNLPEILKLPETEITPLAGKEDVLFYTEIPVGGLVADMFSKERMDRIKNISENVEISAKKIKDLARELKDLTEEEKKLTEELQILTNQCRCENTRPNPSVCSYFGDCPVSPPTPRPYCSGEPCLNRGTILRKNGEIEEKKKEIFQKEKGICKFMYSSAGEKIEVGNFCQKLYSPDDLEELNSILTTKEPKGFVYWREKLEIEINGTGEEKIIGIKKLYEDLMEAESLIKKCPVSSSKQGKTQQLLGYDDFWKYREALEKEGLIKKAEVERPWDYIKVDASSNPYYLATFYCTEYFYKISASAGDIKIDKEALEENQRAVEELLKQEPLLKMQETFCGSEIPIGNTIDDAEDLAKKLTEIIQNFNQKTQNISAATENMVSTATAMKEIKDFKELIDEIQSYNCNSGCQPWVEPWVVCTSSTDSEGNTITTCNSGEDKCCVIGAPAKRLSGDGNSPGCSWYIPALECRGTPGTKKTPSPQAEIGSRAAQFANLFLGIDNLLTAIKDNYEGTEGIIKIRKDLINLIDGEGVEDRLKISKILEKLNVSKNGLGVCYNSVEAQRQALRGEKVILRKLLSCTQIKEYGLLKFFFYDEKSGKAIKECYGPEVGKENQTDNYFCCKSEVGL